LNIPSGAETEAVEHVPIDGCTGGDVFDGDLSIVVGNFVAPMSMDTPGNHLHEGSSSAEVDPGDQVPHAFYPGHTSKLSKTRPPGRTCTLQHNRHLY
jgi:hypothetical protein